MSETFLDRYNFLLNNDHTPIIGYDILVIKKEIIKSLFKKIVVVVVETTNIVVKFI